jgi:hypothetical protein
MRAPPFNLGQPLADFPDASHERLLLYKLPLVGFVLREKKLLLTG